MRYQQWNKTNNKPDNKTTQSSFCRFGFLFFLKFVTKISIKNKTT
jgi:hypothetical protein